MPWWSHYLLSSLSVVLTLLFVSTILRSKRPAGSTIAWLLIICVIPYVGIPLYLFLSERKFGSKSKKKRKLYEPAPNSIITVPLPATEKILLASGTPPVRSNSTLNLLSNGEDAYQKIIELIQGAKKSIHITTFIFGDDVVGNAVVNALCERAKSGVDVRLIVDSLGATLLKHPSFNRLKQAGGKFAYFMPVFHLPFRGRTNLRNHRKLMIVDQKFAVLGGMNLAKEYLGPKPDPNRWIDLGILIQGDSVSDIQEVFLQDWAYANHEENPSSIRTSPALPVNSNEKLSQVIASGPDIHGDPLYDVLLNSIYNVKTALWIVTPYFIPDESLTKALELAARRGVSIHVILPRHSNHKLADFARGSFIRQLSAAGVHFCFYPKMIHAKAVLIDQSLAILGSANFDMRSLLLNYELGILLFSKENLEALQNWIVARKNESTIKLPEDGFVRELLDGIGRVLGPIL